MILVHFNNLALANCDNPNINGKVCESVVAAFKKESCDQFSGDVIAGELCKDFAAGFHEQNCDDIYDSFGHCKAALSFKENNCADIDISQTNRPMLQHQKIICETLNYSNLGGFCEDLQVFTTINSCINSAELVGICEGLQTVTGITPASGLENIRLSIRDVSEKLDQHIKKIHSDGNYFSDYQEKTQESSITSPRYPYLQYLHYDKEIAIRKAHEDYHQLSSMVSSGKIKGFPKRGIFLGLGGERSWYLAFCSIAEFRR